jgi:ATP-binding cassette subfamily B protein
MAAPKTSNLHPFTDGCCVRAGPYWPHVTSIVLLGLLSPLALLMPLPLKIAVDSMLGSQPLPALLGVLMPAGVAQSASAVLALTVGLTVATLPLSELQALATSFLQADGKG